MLTLASQFLSTLMQLLFSLDRDMRVGKTLIQTLASLLLRIVCFHFIQGEDNYEKYGVEIKVKFQAKDSLQVLTQFHQSGEKCFDYFVFDVITRGDPLFV